MPPSTTEPSPALRISVVHPEDAARDHWCRALRAELAQATVFPWPGPQPAPTEAATHFGVGWKPPAEYFAEHPGLSAFFTAGAGVDHLLGLNGLPEALPIVRLEDAGMADQMFVYCLHEILRGLNRADEYERQQREGRWHELAARPLASLRIGVFGLGALGGELAGRLAALGFTVSGFARSAHRIDGVRCLHGDAQWPGFLAGCDVLVLMAPLTADTRHVIGARALAMLPPGAWLINVARGALVDEGALLAALDTGPLAGATLDVFAHEPLPAAHAFWQHPKIRLTPHVAAQTLIDPSARQVADKIRRLLQRESVSGLVDRQRGY
ncbi:MAG TPA: glyoxylate/hydroxypyruvate reductase A [Burkholderiaceae bacterium]|jgi:glyoxylate/hydroxypyruvate reductase A|nr:glyoxylate/hydroxypyruvate reductase A [Burkholderiaceae bacterium]